MRPARQKFSQRSVFRVDETLYKVIRDPSHHVRCEKKFLYLLGIYKSSNRPPIMKLRLSTKVFSTSQDLIEGTGGFILATNLA